MYYVDRMDLTAPIGGSKALEEAVAKIGELRKGVPGYLGQTLLRSYARPHKYTVMGHWLNIETAWAFSSSEMLVTFLEGLPEDKAFTRTRFDGYDSVIEVDTDPLPPLENARCEVLVDWELSSVMKVADFEASRRELYEIRKRYVEGFVSARLRRSSGDPTKYLMVGTYTSKESADRERELPQLHEFFATHPFTDYADVSPSIEAYAVVHRM